MIKTNDGKVPLSTKNTILRKAPVTNATYPTLAFSGPNTTMRVFLPVALSLSWSGNSLIYTTAAIKKPSGIPAKKASGKSLPVCTSVLPATIKGPKFSPMSNSPKPFLDENLNGGAV